MTAPATCRSCGATALRTILSYGEMPLADALVTLGNQSSAETQFPLTLVFCPHCTLVQILESVPPEVLFVQDYPYYSSFSDSVLAHSRAHAEGLIASRGLNSSSLVVEIASNDGYLLKNFVKAGVPVLGIDPAPGQATAAEAIGVPTLTEFFGIDLARRLVSEGRKADVIIANNVMAHVPDLNGFVAGLRELLTDDGLITVENPYIRDLIDHLEFDTVYHEHHCYFSCTAIDRLVRRHGLFLNDVEYFPNLHGGTLRWHIGPREHVSARTLEYLANEEARGVTQFEYYREFGAEVASLRSSLRTLLTGLKREGKSIAAYGAAAKGSTLLNFAGIGTETIDFVVDRNHHKVGRGMPGVHIPIRPVDALLTDRPDYVLLLAWNFKGEIIAQQTEYAARGGRFIVPVPRPEIVRSEPVGTR